MIKKIETKKLDETQYPKTIQLKKGNGEFLEITYYRNLKDLKTREMFCEFAKTDKISEEEFIDYVNQITKLELEPDLRRAKQDLVRQQDVLKADLKTLYIDDNHVCAYELAGDLEPEFDDEEYFIKNGAGYARRLYEERQASVNKFEEKISLINFVAKKAKILIVDKNIEQSR